MKKPVLSVIIPVYNSEKYIKKCAKSVLTQTLSDLELILVDDGSTDCSLRICGEIALTDARVRVITKKNGGVSSARNVGMDASRGEWIGFVDADDTIERDMYEYLVQEASQKGADIAQCGVFFDGANGRKRIFTPKREISTDVFEKIGSKFLKNFSFAVWSKIYRADTVRKIRFDSAYVIGEDLRFNLDALFASGRALILPMTKYHYIQRDESICNREPSYAALTSFRNMLITAGEDYGKRREMKKFISAQRLISDANTVSEIVRSKGEYTELIKKIRRDIRKSFLTLIGSGYISLKDKLKLTLVAYAFGIYRSLLRKIK